MLRTLYAFSKPTIARVHGAAFGGGVGLVACCDIAIAAQEATFALSEAKLGLIPATISPLRDRGDRRAPGAALLPHGGALRRRRGVSRIGLVHDIVPLEELDGRINELLGALLVAGPHAQAECKALIRAVAHRPIDDGGDRRHRRAHRARARVAGSARKASRRSSASARPPGCRADLRTNEHAARPRAVRHVAARRAGGGARLGERHPAVRGAVHRRRLGYLHWVDLPAGSRCSRIRGCWRPRASCSSSSSSPTRCRAWTRCGTSCTRSSAFRRAPRSRRACSATRRRRRRRSRRRSSAARSPPAATSRRPAAAR